MNKKLWQWCIECKAKCCEPNFATPLFLTPREKKSFPKINKTHPCLYFNKHGLCDIHNQRPFDCRFFPFDIDKQNGKFYWIVWHIDCPIVKNDKLLFEDYLLNHEKKLMPKFKKFLEEYCEYRDEELKSKFKYEIIREINL